MPVPHGLLAIEFVLADAQWRCELQAEWDWGREPPSDYECTKQDGPPGAAPAEPATSRVSPDRKWEAFVQNGNVMIRPAGTGAAGVALSNDGTPMRPYSTGSLRWSPDAKSVSAYRVDPAVWQSDAQSGDVKTSIARGMWSVPGR